MIITIRKRINDPHIPAGMSSRPGATEVLPSEFLAELVHLVLVIPGPWPVAFKISMAGFRRISAASEVDPNSVWSAVRDWERHLGLPG
jgi:hypothetical protein